MEHLNPNMKVELLGAEISKRLILLHLGIRDMEEKLHVAHGFFRKSQMEKMALQSFIFLK